MNNIQSLVIGIVSGIVTSALIYLAVTIFKKIVVPWYQELVYQGLEIDGEWRMTFDNLAQDVVLNIAQHAYRLTGTATFLVREETSRHVDSIRVFKLQGTISNRFVVLNLQHTEKNRLGIATSLLEVIGDGQRMIGYWSFYDVMHCQFFSLECSSNRVNISDTKPSDPTAAQSNNGMHPTADTEVVK